MVENNGIQMLREEQRDFRFELQPFFTTERISLTDERYFPNPSSSVLHVGSCSFPAFANPYIENEIRGFIQHMVIERHYSPSTIRGYMDAFVRTFGRFISSVYPDCASVLDIDYFVLLNAYGAYLQENGLPLEERKVVHTVNRDMDWVYYNAKSTYVYGFNVFYRFISETVLDSEVPALEKDVWDLRKMNIPYHPTVHRNRNILNFTDIQQPWLKSILKQYIAYRIRNRSFAAVEDDIKGMKIFSRFLAERYPQMQSLTELSREITEEYVAYVRACGYATSAANRRVSVLKTFLSIGNILNLPGLPTVPLVFNSDYEKVVHHLPKYYTENELKQLNAHIAELPKQTGRILFVLENCGMRLSDLVSTPIVADGISCLTANAEGEYTFRYYMPKVNRYNTIPVNGLTAEILQDAIQESRDKFGEKCVYVFARTVDTPISVDVFLRHMNNMSKNNNLMKDDGSPLRVKGHTFRGTIATRYANCGISMDVIRALLGQQKIGVLKHYITIHDATMIDCMRSITEADDERIRNIGKNGISTHTVLGVGEEQLRLPNGICCRKGNGDVCRHANACYSCRMFHPDKAFLPLYRSQLQEAENNIEIAQLHGYTRFREINETLRDQLQRIIQEVISYDEN